MLPYMSSDFFSKNKFPWKTNRYYVCRSGWQLWIALELIQKTYGERHANKEERKEAIKSIPGEPHPTCRCKDCRYHRLVYKYKNP